MTPRLIALMLLNILLLMLVVALLPYPACERAAQGFTWRLSPTTRRCEVAVSVGQVSNIVWVDAERLAWGSR